MATPSQKFIPVSDIRDGIIMLNDGKLVGVLLVSAVNLALKSPEEQEATIFGFQNFINTLDFSMQIVVQSRRANLQPYINSLDERLKVIPEELLRLQTRMYIEYIKNISEGQNIMEKRFFVVVPYVGLTSAKKSGFLGLGGSGDINTKTFEEQRTQLEQRLSVVRSGLGALGLRMSDLSTEDAVDILYKLYNPGDISNAKALVS